MKKALRVADAAVIPNRWKSGQKPGIEPQETAETLQVLLYSLTRSQDSQTRQDAASFFLDLFEGHQHDNHTAKSLWKSRLREVALPDELKADMVRAMDYPEEDVRLGAIMLCAHFRIEEASSSIVGLLRTSPESGDFREWAIEALARTGGSKAVDYLVSYVKDRNAHYRCWAMEAIGLIGDASASDLLIGIAKSRNEEDTDRTWAAYGAALLGSATAKELLLRKAKRSDGLDAKVLKHLDRQEPWFCKL